MYKVGQKLLVNNTHPVHKGKEVEFFRALDDWSSIVIHIDTEGKVKELGWYSLHAINNTCLDKSYQNKEKYNKMFDVIEWWVDKVQRCFDILLFTLVYLGFPLLAVVALYSIFFT